MDGDEGGAGVPSSARARGREQAIEGIILSRFGEVPAGAAERVMGCLRGVEPDRVAADDAPVPARVSSARRLFRRASSAARRQRRTLTWSMAVASTAAAVMALTWAGRTLWHAPRRAPSPEVPVAEGVGVEAPREDVADAGRCDVPGPRPHEPGDVRDAPDTDATRRESGAHEGELAGAGGDAGARTQEPARGTTPDGPGTIGRDGPGRTAPGRTVARAGDQRPVPEVIDGGAGPAPERRPGRARLVSPGAVVPVSAPRVAPIDIVLGASEGMPVGDDWRRVDDPDAAGGTALECLAPDAVRGPLAVRRATSSWVEYSFPARSNTEFFVWVRARALGVRETGPQAPEYPHAGMVKIDAPTGEWTYLPQERTRHPATVAWAERLGLPAPCFNGFHRAGAGPGYRWSGGPADPADLERMPWRLKLRFWTPGTQTLRLHALDGPLRVDALWLSSTQETRPAATQRGPARGD